jgi:hypothetical protein
MVVKTIFAAALAIFQSAFSLVAADNFGLDAAGTGQLLSFVGGLSILGSTVLVPLAGSLPPTRACILSGAVLAASLGAFSVTSSATQLFLLCVPQALAGVVFSTINGAQLSTLVAPSLQGSLHAADMAIGSAVRIASPAVSAWLLSAVGFWSIGASSGSLMAVVTLCFMSGFGTAEAASAQAKAE